MEDRVSRLEGAYGQVADRLNSMDANIEGLRRDLRSEIGGLRSELGGEIGGLRSELASEIGGLRSELRGEIGELRREMSKNFRVVIASIVASWVTITASWITTILTVFHQSQPHR